MSAGWESWDWGVGWALMGQGNEGKRSSSSKRSLLVDGGESCKGIKVSGISWKAQSMASWSGPRKTPVRYSVLGLAVPFGVDLRYLVRLDT